MSKQNNVAAVLNHYGVIDNATLTHSNGAVHIYQADIHYDMDSEFAAALLFAKMQEAEEWLKAGKDVFAKLRKGERNVQKDQDVAKGQTPEKDAGNMENAE